MNRIFTLVSAVLLSASLWAQSPQSFSYQAVVRGANNALVANKKVGIKISLLQGSETGTAVYAETHMPTSNENGLVSIAIGGGTKDPSSATFANIDWSNGPYFVKTETDVAGGTNYSLITSSQLMSVPYALYAANSQTGPKGDKGEMGANGAKGATGDQGLKGDQGIQGNQGAKGDKGDQGNGYQNGTVKNQISYWDGSAWVVLNPGSLGQTLTSCEDGLIWTTGGVCPGKISTLDCAGVLVKGSLYKGDAASVSFEVSYEGGNGGPYPDQSIKSSGVDGLTATIRDDYFSQVGGWGSNGSGSLKFEVTGTPTSEGNALFSLNIGGQTCSISLVVKELIIIALPGENITDVDNNSYKTVTIGTQVWMAENLKVSKYNDGTNIPNEPDNNNWSQLTTGAWVYYNNDEANNDKYGKLYNWYSLSPTMNGNKNVCPIGWHVPTDAEWTVLTDYLGGEGVAGGRMKEVGTTNWNSPNNFATNISLFTLLPGGYRNYDGSFYTIGDTGSWWSSKDSYAEHAWYLYQHGDDAKINRRDHAQIKNGLSVRCLKD